MKRHLLCGVAAVAFSVGLAAATPASAFDSLNWSWDADKYQNVYVNNWTWGWFHPTGEVQVEKLQVYVGDVIASATLNGDYDPDQQVEASSVDFVVTWEGTQDDSTDPSTFGTDVLGAGPATLSGDLSGTGTLSGVLDEGDDAMSLTITFEDIDIDLSEIVEVFDAVDHLGHATQDVSAVGIADSIESAVPVYAHEGQFLFDADDDYNLLPKGGCNGGNSCGNDDLSLSGNRFHDVAALLALGAGFGMIDPAKIVATAHAGWYRNPVEIAIAQDVSAVAEVLSIELAALQAPSLIEADGGEDLPSTGDTILMKSAEDLAPDEVGEWYAVFQPYSTDLIIEADITQFAYADTYASAFAVQDLTSYNNLGAYDRLGEAGLVAAQNVSAAGLVANIKAGLAEATE